MITTHRSAAMAGLLALAALTSAACGDMSTENEGLGHVKSIHKNEQDVTGRHYVVCQSGNTYREVDLTQSVIALVKIGDNCPTQVQPTTSPTAKLPGMR